ncbi:MAG TPA: 3-deoxy-manno-octulosonate cytidylyltransferase [Steroidobacteraceae bacterium]|nr:3-deoxy-manno-octulosonate cytidylyltransferase [Steroidobacteraceae bacterium]
MFRVVIPARFGSTRLPGKSLKMIGGKPMLQWVHEAGVAAGAAEVIIATDDERILEAARDFGAQARMTSLTHPSGTDRIAEVAAAAGWDDEDIVVNLQGDEPLMPPALVGQVAGLLEKHADAAVATLAARISSVAQLLDPGVVKVVADSQGRALYFSRAPVPWNRDTAPASLVSQRSFAGARRHIGLYAYRVAALQRLSMLPPGQLEQIERLEQLRALEHRFEIRVADATASPGPAVDTEEDLARVRTLMNRAEAPQP